MKESLKKYWFIFVIALLMIGGVIYFSVEKNKDVVKGKQVNGETIVYSLKNDDVTANSFYDSLYESMGASTMAQMFQFAVINQAIETTPEMEEEAKANADYTISQFKSTYGAAWEETLMSALRSLGYEKVDDLKTHMLLQIKYNEMLMAATDDLFVEFEQEYQPRVLSHILVKMEDPENPTAEELAKWEEVKQALADGVSFEEVATKYSDDTGSALNKGSLGYSDKTTQYVTEFLEAALALNAGEYSEWVKTAYGYHLIRVDATDLETLKTYEDFLSALFAAYPEYVNQLLFDYADAIGVTYATPEIETQIKAVFGIGGNE